MTDALRDELVALTTDLMRFESTAERPDKLAAVMDYAHRYIESIPNLYIQRSEADRKPAIVVTLRDTYTPALMLNGHLDVVAARPDQFEPEVRDGRIYGRGGQDMKGSVSVMLRLLKDLAALETRPDVGFQFVSDEEIGGANGTRRLRDESWRCGFFIALEPTDMHICYEQKGLMWVELLFPGAPAHGSRPWEGRNPLLALGEGIVELNRHLPTPNSSIWRTTVTPTAAYAGGGSQNQVPPEARLVFDIRYTAADTPDAIMDLLHACFPTAEVALRQQGAAMTSSPDTPEIQRLAAVNTQVRAQPTDLYREHFASDARFYSTAGIPAICYGPVGAGLHSDDEWVAIDSLVEMHSVLLTYIRELP